MITVEIPMAVMSGNKFTNQKSRWAYKTYRDKWYRVLILFFPPRKGRPDVRISVKIISVRARYLDTANFAQGCKPILDHLKKSNYIFDDSPRWIDDKYEQVIDKKNQKTIITVGG